MLNLLVNLFVIYAQLSFLGLPTIREASELSNRDVDTSCNLMYVDV
jgi:hypothetical protein